MHSALKLMNQEFAMSDPEKTPNPRILESNRKLRSAMIVMAIGCAAGSLCLMGLWLLARA